MSNPNIVNVSAIYGQTSGLAVTTSATALVSNSSSSGKVYKINSLVVSNIDGVNAADVTVEVYKNQSTSMYLAYTITVPADASLVVISKDTSIYLNENDSLRLTASVNSDLYAVCSWDEIN